MTANHIFDCAHVGCKKKATHHLEIRVWPKGQPKLKHNFFSASWSLLLCHKHAITAKAEHIVTDELWGALNAACHSQSKAPPDRASIEVHAAKGMPKNFAEMKKRVLS